MAAARESGGGLGLSAKESDLPTFTNFFKITGLPFYLEKTIFDRL